MENNLDVLQILAELVAIPSVNPSYEGGVPEAAVGEYVERFCATHGIETFRQDVLPGRFNVIARLPGQRPERRVVLEAHMDTVSVNGMTIPPFTPEIREGKLYGRGSCDTKAGLAGMLHALATVKASGVMPPCEIWLAAVVDEEYSFRGVVKLCEGLQAHAAIVAEPTEMRLVTASKGVLRWRMRTRGKAAHSAKPHLGVNAISLMADVIQALDQHTKTLAARSHPLLGPATLNIGMIHGGEQINFVPDVCEIAIDRRLIPGEDAETVWEEYARLAAELGAEIDRPLLADGPLETPVDSDAVHAAQRVMVGLGRPVAAVGVPFGSDASKLARQGVPSIIFGPGSIDRAHAAVEYVECDQVQEAATFFRQFILEFV
ncbi:MAG TPA: M20 family metallopeptidase [Bryobacteraceae bacterium]|nr:M20 family metallopeptidase [Bryobacteraceae bacterium]